MPKVNWRWIMLGGPRVASRPDECMDIIDFEKERTEGFGIVEIWRLGDWEIGRFGDCSLENLGVGY